MTPEEEDRFRSHPYGGGLRAEIHNKIREAARNFAEVVTGFVPPGRERSIALTHIEDAMMWANMGVARTFIPEKGE